MTNEPVDVTADFDNLYGGTMVRVYFRHSAVYSQVDLTAARHGGQMLEEMARACVLQKNAYQHNQMQKAYSGREPVRREGGQSAPPPKKRPLVDQALNAYRETNKHAVVAKPNSYDNPLRVELQKKVDAWLK